MQELSDWEVEDLLSSLLSPSSSPDVLSSSSSSILHDHNYSLPQEHVSIDLGECEMLSYGGKRELTELASPTFAFADPGSFEKEGFRMNPLRVEETAAEQVLGLVFQDYLTLQRPRIPHTALISPCNSALFLQP